MFCQDNIGIPSSLNQTPIQLIIGCQSFQWWQIFLSPCYDGFYRNSHLSSLICFGTNSWLLQDYFKIKKGLVLSLGLLTKASDPPSQCLWTSFYFIQHSIFLKSQAFGIVFFPFSISIFTFIMSLIWRNNHLGECSITLTTHNRNIIWNYFMKECEGHLSRTDY